MQVKQEHAIILLEALGVKMVKGWTLEQVQARVDKIESLVDEDEPLESEKHQKLLDKILSAQENGEPVEVVGNGGRKADKVETPSIAPKKKAAAKKADPEPEEDEEDAPKSKKKPAKDKADKEDGRTGRPRKGVGEGVIGTIIKVLASGTAKKPVTKDKVHKVLTDKFPDRSPDSMRNTINIQIPSRLWVDKGVKVSKNENGYWIEPEDLEAAKDFKKGDTTKTKTKSPAKKEKPAAKSKGKPAATKRKKGDDEDDA